MQFKRSIIIRRFILKSCTVYGNVGSTSVTKSGTVTGTKDIGNPAYSAAIGTLTIAINTTTLRTLDETLAAVELGGLDNGTVRIPMDRKYQAVLIYTEF